MSGLPACLLLAACSPFPCFSVCLFYLPYHYLTSYPTIPLVLAPLATVLCCPLLGVLVLCLVSDIPSVYAEVHGRQTVRPAYQSQPSGSVASYRSTVQLTSGTRKPSPAASTLPPIIGRTQFTVDPQVRSPSSRTVRYRRCTSQLVPTVEYPQTTVGAHSRVHTNQRNETRRPTAAEADRVPGVRARRLPARSLEVLGGAWRNRRFG